MSVLVSDRTESKFEPITYSTELHNMLREFMQRNFGVKDLEHFVQLRYAYGKDDTEDFGKYRYLMLTHKKEIDHLATLMTNNVRAANSIYDYHEGIRNAEGLPVLSHRELRADH